MKNFLSFAFEKDMINTRNINDQKKKNPANYDF